MLLFAYNPIQSFWIIKKIYILSIYWGAQVGVIYFRTGTFTFCLNDADAVLQEKNGSLLM